MKSKKQIIILIEEALNENPKIGFLKDDLLYIPIAISLEPLSLLLGILSIVFTIIAIIEKFNVLFIGVLISIFLIFIIFISFAISCYLVFDITNQTLNKKFKLFNVLTIFQTNIIKNNRVERLSLTTKNVLIMSKHPHSALVDSIYLELGKKVKLPIESVRFYYEYHPILIDRYSLLSSCLGVKFKIIEDSESINKVIEEQREMGSRSKWGCFLDICITLVIALLFYFIIFSLFFGKRYF